MTKPLSPAAQAILDAFENASDGEYIEGVWVVNERTMLAAALRAYALLISKHDPCIDVCPTTEEEAMVNGIIWRNRQIHEELLATAAELGQS